MTANPNLLKQLSCLILLPMLGLASSAVIADAEEMNHGTGVPSLYDFSSPSFGTTSNLFDQSIVLAAAQEAKGESATQPEQCLKFAGNPDADLGDVIRAGCKPSLGQMSALMDNPLGNVAMLFSQYDYYRLKNDANGIEKDQHVYTGIFQFPKKLNDDWNLISRIIWTVPSVPAVRKKLIL